MKEATLTMHAATPVNGQLVGFVESSLSPRRLAERIGEVLAVKGEVFTVYPDHTSVNTDNAALDSIAELLSAERWSVEDLESIADIVRATGRVIEDTDESDEG